MRVNENDGSIYRAKNACQASHFFFGCMFISNGILRLVGDFQVSWIRKRDLHILTVGVLTYTSDQRFQIIRTEKSSNWTLQIKFPQMRDSGIYECQVNTEPKMSLPFRLNVVGSSKFSHILQNCQKFLEHVAKSQLLPLIPVTLVYKVQNLTGFWLWEGSSVTFICKVNQGPHDLNTVFWYKDGNLLQPIENNQFQRITVQNAWKDSLTSQLHINRVNWSDSGKYSCVPTIAQPADTNLYVITGEHPAAMYHGNRNSSATISSELDIFTALTVLILSKLR
ncbi:hypothetical protein HUJ05_007413 [Dendroctonus ponderosae]|nr:hypothetical protein HUJ05_007413 [Dendroctonus ponderosae]